MTIEKTPPLDRNFLLDTTGLLFLTFHNSRKVRRNLQNHRIQRRVEARIIHLHTVERRNGVNANGIQSVRRPCVIGRQPFGRIHIANSDADGHAYTNIAIDQGYRAVREITAGGKDR
jgi:hypothetical protein